MFNDMRKRLSQLGKKAGQSRNTINILVHIVIICNNPPKVNWENGYRKPDMDNLIAIAKFFCASLDYLVGLDNY